MKIPALIGNILVDGLGMIVIGLIVFVAFFAWLNRRNDTEGTDSGDFDPMKTFAGNIQRGKDPELDLDAEEALKAYSQTGAGKSTKPNGS